MDKNGYPDVSELEKIINWDYKDLKGLMDYVYFLWWCPDWGWKQRGNTYRLSTGGRSGNEDIIGALQNNLMFWGMCWQKSTRGGHYVFKIPKLEV